MTTKETIDPLVIRDSWSLIKSSYNVTLFLFADCEQLDHLSRAELTLWWRPDRHHWSLSGPSVGGRVRGTERLYASAARAKCVQWALHHNKHPDGGIGTVALSGMQDCVFWEAWCTSSRTLSFTHCIAVWKCRFAIHCLLQFLCAPLSQHLRVWNFP